MHDALIDRTLSKYRVVERLGAGGMGVVYRAVDEHLRRDVALKLLPEELVADPLGRAKLLFEARSASALNHPNVCTIHEVGEADGRAFIVMELVAGRPLSELVSRSALPTETVVRYGSQIADALSHAHTHGVIHRDLKASNIIITPDGRVKVLDFGLAMRLPGIGVSSSAPTEVELIPPDAVVGTLPYMAPEVLRGNEADARTDLWGLGVVLYEMSSQERPFRGQTGFEVSAAILSNAPPPLPARVPVGIRTVILRCLEKEPGERYQRAGEVRAALDMLGASPRDDGEPDATVRTPARRWRWPRVAFAAAALLAMGVLGVLVTRNYWPKAPPTTHQLTFQRGLVGQARFGPDGRTAIYSAAWDENPFEVFSASPGTPESRPLDLPDTWLLSVSSSGEMALLKDHHLCPGPFAIGTLGSASLSGTAARDMAEGIEWADWSPDGKDLAVVHEVGDKYRLEFPSGRVLCESSGWITHPRMSPRGDKIGFLEHPLQGDFSGAVVVLDLKGKRTSLSEGWNNVWGLAWSRNGKELWFTAKKAGPARALYAVSMSGRQRQVYRESNSLVLMDISRDGRVLLAQQTDRSDILGRFPGEGQERELSWLDWSCAVDLSADGSALLTQVGGGGGGGPMGSVWIRKTQGSQRVRLGDGEALALSSDGKWVLAKLPGPEPAQLAVWPTGVGEQKRLPRDSITRKYAAWLPGGDQFLSAGSDVGRAARDYVQDIHGGPPRPVTPEGVSGIVISPDGKWVAMPDRFYSIDGEEPREVPGLADGDVPIRWSKDGRSLYVQNGDLPAAIYRIDLASRRREPWRELYPADPAGLTGIFSPLLTPDASAYVYTYNRSLSELYLVDGLR